MATLFFNIEADYAKVVQLREEIARLQNAMSSFDASTSVNQIAEYERRLAAAKAQMSSFVATAANAGMTFQTSLVNEIKASKNSFNSLRGEIKSAQGELGALGQGIGGFAKQFTAAALAIKGLQMAVGALKGASDTIIDFQAANSMLRAVMGESEEGLLQLRNRAEELGRTTVFTASQVTQLEIALAKLGFQRDQILDMSAPILQYAQATGARLDEAASNAGAALRMFGAESSETARYVGAMSAAINSSALNFQAVSDNLATFGPVAKSIGLSIEESLAIFGKLKDAGYEGSTAATSVRNILNELAGGKLAKELGYTVNSFEGLVKALEDLEERGYAGTQAVGKAMKAVGKRGGAQLLTLIQQKEGLKELYQRIKDGEDGMGNLAKTMNDNVAGSIKLLQSAWEGFVLSFSNSTGFMAQSINVVTDAINSMTNFISEGTGRIGTDEMNNIIGVVVGLTSAYAVYKAEIIGVEAVEKVRAALGAAEYARYQTMVAQLQQVTAAQTETLSVELEAAVSKGVLTREQALYISSLQATVKAQYQSLQAQLAKAQAEEADAIALEHNMLLEQQKAAMQLANAQKTGNAQKIAAAEKKLLQANTDLETAAEIRNTAATQVNTTSKQLSAVGSAIDTQGKIADTGATWSLTAAMEALNLTFLESPITWIAIAVGALAFAIYKFSTMTDGAKEAQDALNESMRNYRGELDSSKTEAEGWIKIMQDNTATALQQVDAYEKLKKAYEDFGNYTPDEIASMSKEERDTIINRANENKEEEYLKKRAAVYKETEKGIDSYSNVKGAILTNGIIGLYADAAIKKLEVDKETAERIRKEIEDAGKDGLVSIAEFAKQSKAMAEQFDDNKSYANVTKTIQAIGDMQRSNLDKKTLDDYNATLKKVVDYANNNPIVLTDKSNKEHKALFADIEESMASLKDKSMHLTDDISKTNDKARKEELKRQKEDVDKIISFYSALSTGVEEGGKGAVKAVKAYSDYLDKMEASSDVAIIIGDAYKKSMDLMGEVAREHQDGGKILEDTVSKNKKAVTDEVKHIKAKIEELKRKLQDPKLKESEKQQIKVDLIKSEQALKDVNSLLDKIDLAIKNKGSYKVIIDFITRFFEEGQKGKKVVREEGKREYTYKGKRKSITYDWYEEEIVENNGKRGKMTTYHMSDGKTKKIYDPIVDTLTHRAQKAIQTGNKAKEDAVKKDESKTQTTKTEEDDKEREKRLKAERKRKDIEDKKYENDKKRERDIEDSKMKIRKADIDKMEEGVAKSVELAKYQYEKTLLDLKRSEEDKRAELYRTAKTEWEAENEGAFKKGRNGFDITDEDKKSYQKQAEVAEKTYADAIRNAYKNYSPAEEQKRKEQLYARDILAMQKELEKARSDGNKEDIAFWTKRVKYAQYLKDKLSDTSMDEFYAKYGSFDEKMSATNNEYMRKLRDTQNDPNKGEGDIMSVRREWENAISSLNLSKLKEDINWEAVFGDLDKVSSEHLKTLKSNLQQYLGADLTVDQYKDIANAIEEINNKIVERQGKWKQLFGAINPYLDKLKQAKSEAISANANYELQVAKLASMKADKDTARIAINAKLGKKGKVTDGTTYEEFQKMVSEANPSERMELESLFETLNQMKAKIGVQENVTDKARKSKEDKDEAAEVLGKNTKEKLQGFSTTLDLVNSNMQSMPELLATLGVDMESKFAKGMSSLADTSAHVTSAFKNLLSLNFVGAINDSLQALGSLGNALGSFGIKGFGDSDPELKKDLEHLTNVNRDLEKAISDLTEEMVKSGTNNATILYTKSREYVKQTMDNTQEKMLRSAKAYNSGFFGIGGKHSSGKKINEALSQDDWKRISEITGESVKNASDFFSLTSEKMAKVSMYATDLWTTIKEKGESGRENVSQYMDEYVELYKKLDELEDKYLEKMTTKTFDGFKDEFRSLLLDMDVMVSDFSDSMEDNFRQAVINSLMDEVFDERLKAIQKRIADFVESGANDKSEKEAILNDYKNLSKEYMDARDQLFNDLDLDSPSASQKSSVRSVGSMTQDTAEVIAGRATSLQMATEGILQNCLNMLDIPLSMLNESIIQEMGTMASIRGIADEAREYMVLSYLELQGINENTSVMAKFMKEMANNMKKVKDNTNNI